MEKLKNLTSRLDSLLAVVSSSSSSSSSKPRVTAVLNKYKLITVNYCPHPEVAEGHAFSPMYQPVNGSGCRMMYWDCASLPSPGRTIQEEGPTLSRPATGAVCLLMILSCFNCNNGCAFLKVCVLKVRINVHKTYLRDPLTSCNDGNDGWFMMKYDNKTQKAKMLCITPIT